VTNECDRQTDITVANAALNYVARPKITNAKGTTRIKNLKNTRKRHRNNTMIYTRITKGLVLLIFDFDYRRDTEVPCSSR